MIRDRRTKILATLGPSSSSSETINKLLEGGADLFRINMSHASHEVLRELVGKIRAIEQQAEHPIGILADLQGPKLRLGDFSKDKIKIKPGDRITLDLDDTPGTSSRVNLPHPEILSALEIGDRVIIDDGKVELVIVEETDKKAVAEVVSGSKLSSRKGVSLPDTELGMGSLTKKDYSDLEAALAADVDWIAVSFVQRPEDIAEVRKIVKGRAGILAKIEKPQAVNKLDDIIELSDAIMIARGDLGVEMPIERLPGLQKQITRACRKVGKPVVVATQMLESMISAPFPTRAEVSDVGTAVFEGADAIMLSAESAAGEYPVEAVAMMDRIAAEIEQDQNYPQIIASQRSDPEPTGADAISLASRQIAETLNLSAIVCYTGSGTTGLRAARERPPMPIIALSPVRKTARRLSIVWGLHCVTTEDAKDLDDMVDRACRIAAEAKIAKPGDRIIITAGVPLGTPGATNMLRIAFVASDGRSGI